MTTQFRSVCSICNTPVTEEQSVCPSCGEDVFEANDVKRNDFSPLPAGFWVRGVALLIDTLILSPLMIASIYNLYHFKNYFLLLMLTIPMMIYQPYMESRYGATIGKKAMKLQVIDKQGRYLSLSKAYVRFIPSLLLMITAMASNYYLYNLPDFEQATTAIEIARLKVGDPTNLLYRVIIVFVYIDVLTIVFNRRKRAIHDFLASSYCIKKG